MAVLSAPWGRCAVAEVDSYEYRVGEFELSVSRNLQKYPLMLLCPSCLFILCSKISGYPTIRT